MTFPLYLRERNKTRLILRELERGYGHKEKVDPATLTIEHIMPQTIGANPAGRAWKRMLGPEWRRVQEEWLHTAGNLTLTGYNPDIGNKPFDRKKFALNRSHLELNKYFARLKNWDEDSIRKRGEEMARAIVQLFPKPPGGDSFVPTIDLEDDGSNEARGQFHKRYWTRLNELLKDRESNFAQDETASKYRQRFPTSWPNIRLHAAIFPYLRELRITLTFVKKDARRVFQQLFNQKEAINEEFGLELQWEPERIRRLAVVLQDVNVRDEEDWDAQHDWICDQLDAFQTCFFPKIATFRTGLSSQGSSDTGQVLDAARI